MKKDYIIKAYNAAVSGVKGTTVGLAMYAMTFLPSCMVQEVKTPKDFVNASTKQIQTYAEDGVFNAQELRELASTYQKIDDLLESGVKDEAKKKELETRRALLGQVIDGFFEAGNFSVDAYVSGVTPAEEVKNNSGLETGLSGSDFDAAITAGASDAAGKTRRRSEYLRRLQTEKKDVMNLHDTDVDNDSWHDAYVEEDVALFTALMAKARRGFGQWTHAVHKRYTDGKEANGEVIRTAFSVRMSEDYKVPEAIATAVKALAPAKKGEAESLAELEARVAREVKELETAKKKLEEAKAAKEKDEKEAEEKADKDKTSDGASDKDADGMLPGRG